MERSKRNHWVLQRLWTCSPQNKINFKFSMYARGHYMERSSFKEVTATIGFCIDCGAELLYLAHIGLVPSTQIGLPIATLYIATLYPLPH